MTKSATTTMTTKPGKGLFAALLAAICIELLSKTNMISGVSAPDEGISIMMPDIRPDHAEQYLCMAHRVRRDPKGQFIVEFKPSADAGRVHHMLLYGCQQPGIFQRDSANFVWDCSGMHASPSHAHDNNKPLESTFEQGPICNPKGKSHILYGWGLNAPALKLPEGVGFKIGGTDTDIQFLVLQVHYGHYDMFDRLPDLTDNSGLMLDLKTNDERGGGITHGAGVLLLSSVGFVPPGEARHEIWCEIRQDIELHPFRFRVHTHKLGTRVKGVKISRRQVADDLGLDVDEASLIGSGNPQDPQTFYPVHDPEMVLTRGDRVYATCEYLNNLERDVQIGQTGDDEMCNFYMMYWTNSTKMLKEDQCIGVNPGLSYLEALDNRYPINE